MTDLGVDIGSRLRELRKSKNETLVQTAVAVSIAPSTLWRYETGRYVPRGESLAALSRHFGVSVDRIMFKGEGLVPPEAA